MQLFAPSLAFVDLETTGTRAADDRITEVGIVRVDADARGGPPRIHEWSSLVDPEVPIPAVIQALTGITDAMVAGAPTFSVIAADIEERLADCVFVAHNARFDHGFLKHAFARIGRPFSARPLCTVRLSRRLFPDAHGHGLDAVVARHGLKITDRHRALGDARALWAFVEALYREVPAESIADAVKRILRIPSLPPQLPPDSLDRLPETPGVYLFFGDNALPIYIGKSSNIRDRVASHFAGDWRSETDLRLSQEIRRIEYEETAGELGALLREAMLVKSLFPAHNRALRRKEEAGVLMLADGGAPHYLPAAALDPADLALTYGPFASRRSARDALRTIAADHRLCWRRLGLEKRAGGPCFQRQLKRCAGACVGAEAVADHDKRAAAALAPLAILRWPFAGPAVVSESNAATERTDVHVLVHWCWLGTARDEAELAALLDAPPRPRFDIDVARLLLKRWNRRSLALVDVAPYPRAH
jgi:DNA polymerase-3 subunit epsilon